MTRSFGGRSPVYQPVARQEFDRAARITIPVEEQCYPAFEYLGEATATFAGTGTLGSFTMGGDPAGTYYIVCVVGQNHVFDNNSGLSNYPVSHPGCTTVITSGETAGNGLFQPAWISVLKPNLPSATAPLTITPFDTFYALASRNRDYTVQVVRATNCADYLPGVFYPTPGYDNWLVGADFPFGGSGTGTSFSIANATGDGKGQVVWVHSRAAVPLAGTPLPTTFTSSVDFGGDLDADQQAQGVLAGPFPSYIDGSFTPETECAPAPAPGFSGSAAVTTNLSGTSKLLTFIEAEIRGRTT